MGKPPITILSNQDPWLTEAIGLDLPSTKHSFYIWHITSKFSGWFLSVLRSKYFEWSISKYKLNENSHMNGLYDVRTAWVPAFLRDYFFGGMTTTGRSESINAFVKRFINSHITLRQFLEQVDLDVETITQKKAHDLMLEKHKFPIPKIMSPLEGQVQKILTPYAYEMFREELGRASQYEVFTHFGFEYVLRYFEEGNNTKRRKLFWNGQVITCSFKQFEFCGIVCRHILKIFIHTGCFNIPMNYLPFRWNRDGLRDEQVTSLENSNNIAFQEDVVRDVSMDLMVVSKTVKCPQKSNPKGRLKNAK
ncbi:hypothetical protein MKX03_004030 [Papaver bracteatum]|nr:hypothetical protein MKX03_004030 [Papaver bracteatum]